MAADNRLVRVKDMRLRAEDVGPQVKSVRKTTTTEKRSSKTAGVRVRSVASRKK